MKKYLMRRSLFDDFGDMWIGDPQGDFGRFSSQLIGPLGRIRTSMSNMDKYLKDKALFTVPETNVEETENNYIMSLKIPGVKKEDIKLKASEGRLELTVESKEEKKEENKNYLRQEFRSQSFYRNFLLPKDIKLENIASEYNDGILKITVPKVTPSIQGEDKKYLDIKIQ